MEEVILNVARNAAPKTLELVLHSDSNARGLINKLAPSVNGLHVAVWRNNTDVVELLLTAGADPNAQDAESGWTALHRALYFGNLRIAALLLEANASLHVTDWQGRTPLDLLSQELSPLLPRSGPGDIYSWGNGSNYTLGTGSTGLQLGPARIDALHGAGVVYLSAAKFHSVAVTSQGELLTWGWGHGGRLGHPEAHIHSGQSAVIAPRLVVGLGKRQVVAVAAGKHHTLLCTSAGETYTFGSNRYGQLGYLAVDTQATPRRVATLKCRIVAVAAANKHSVAVSAAGEVFTWGSNALGQLGYGATDSTSSAAPRLVEAMMGKEVVAAAAAKRHTLVLTSSNELFTWGHRGVSPRRIQLAGSRDAATALGQQLTFHRGHSEVVKPTITAICAGAAHSSALTSTGAVLTWRSADPNLTIQEIGGGLAGRRVVHIAAGKYRTAAVTFTGDVYMWEGRADFFPADNRRSGSGSKKSGGAGGRMPIPSTATAPLGVSPSNRGGALRSGSYELTGASNGSSGRKAGSSFLERWHQENNRTGTATTPLGSSPPLDNTSSSYKIGRSPLGMVDAFAKIVPERVDGLKRVGMVAVGEKHSLALQRWSAEQLPGLASVHWLDTAATTRTLAPSDTHVVGEDGEPSTPRNGSSLDLEGINHKAQPSSSTNASPLSSPDQRLSGSMDQRQGTTTRTVGVPTLQSLCEAAVARQIVDPRSALQVMEYADAAGADLLRAHCAAVALCNLDAVLIEAGGAFEALPLHLLEELETVWKARLAGPWIPRGSENKIDGETDLHAAAGSSGEKVPSAVVQRPRRSLVYLQLGRRPTTAPAHLGNGPDASGAEGCLLPTEPVSLQMGSSFKDLNALEEEQATQRLQRTLQKKLQQIERLEELKASGSSLDEQQQCKLAQRALMTAALSALEGGMPADEVANMVKAATVPSTPAITMEAAIKSSSKSGKKVLSKSAGSEQQSKGLAAEGIEKKTDDKWTSSRRLAEPMHDNDVPTFGCKPVQHVVGFSASSSSPASAAANADVAKERKPATPSSRPKSAQPPKIRKGGLSMFLRGDLDADAAAKNDGASPRSPAPWGGEVGRSSTGSDEISSSSRFTSLREILEQRKDEKVTTPGGSSSAAKPPATPTSGGSRSVSLSTPIGSSGKKTVPIGVKIPLATFISPSTSQSKEPRPAAWGGAAGASPLSNAPSLKAIQEQQEEGSRRYIVAGVGVKGASPPGGGPAHSAAALLRRVSTGGSSHVPLGSSPLNRGSSAGLFGSSPTTKPFFPSAGPPQSKWYVPEGHEQRAKSLRAIQTEEAAVQQLAKKLGSGVEVKIVSKRSEWPRPIAEERPNLTVAGSTGKKRTKKSGSTKKPSKT